MGNSQGVQAPGAQAPAAGCPHRGGDAAAQSAAREGACPVSNASQQQQQQQESGCPMHSKGGYKHPKVYNVYSQEIDPTNQMPVNPNNMPAPDQQKP